MGDIERPLRETELEGTGKATVVRIAPRIAAVPAADWDICAGGLATRADNPFIHHVFLRALEESGSATRNTGWLPQHLLLEDERGELAGCMPCYLKSHSLGEYVFDHGWADAYARAGGSYYPKLQVAVPFTPATGRRLLVRPGPHENEIARALAGGLVEICKISGASGVHVTFAPEAEFRLLGDLGYLQRTDQQFHWENSGFSSFE